jgi:hypothetical protein
MECTVSSGVEYIDLGTADPAVVALAVQGKVTGDDMAALIQKIQTIQEQGDKARLYIELSEYTGYELPVVKEKLTHIATLWGGISKCAYVVDKAWMTNMIGLVDAVTPMHLKAYSTEDAADARAWIALPD